MFAFIYPTFLCHLRNILNPCYLYYFNEQLRAARSLVEGARVGPGCASLRECNFSCLRSPLLNLYRTVSVQLVPIWTFNQSEFLSVF